MIRVRTCRGNECVAADGTEALRASGTNGMRWIQVSCPDDAEILALTESLGLHELAVRDAQKVGYPPKVAEFEDYIFFIVHTPVVDEDARTRKIAVFLGNDWVVTIQLFDLTVMEQIAERVEQDPEHFLDSPARLAHEILDYMAVGFETMSDNLHERIGRLEERIMAAHDQDSMRAILKLRREVAWFLRLMRGQRDVCMSLARSAHPAVPNETLAYFRDVYDHVLRIYDMADGARDGLGAARDAHLAVVNNRLSEIMRTLTIIATVMMPLSLLAGIYGMNFDPLPGADGSIGFWIMLAAMVGVVAFMLRSFRKRGWF